MIYAFGDSYAAYSSYVFQGRDPVLGVDPEMALERTNKKFIKRFQYLESESKKDGKEMGEMTLNEMDEYWNKAKKL